MLRVGTTTFHVVLCFEVVDDLARVAVLVFAQLGCTFGLALNLELVLACLQRAAKISVTVPLEVRHDIVALPLNLGWYHGLLGTGALQVRLFGDVIFDDAVGTADVVNDTFINSRGLDGTLQELVLRDRLLLALAAR